MRKCTYSYTNTGTREYNPIEISWGKFYFARKCRNETSLSSFFGYAKQKNEREPIDIHGIKGHVRFVRGTFRIKQRKFKFIRMNYKTEESVECSQITRLSARRVRLNFRFEFPF